MALTTQSLNSAITSVAARLGKDHQHLTDLDAQLGDGDLGVTLLKAFRALEEIRDTLPPDVGLALLTCGSAVSKVSSSSFGTLMATALLAVAKDCRGKTAVEWGEMARLLRLGRSAMMARGKAALGDKTVLDSLAAIEAALEGTGEPENQLMVARQAAQAALADFRRKPNRIGRARVYAERSVGVDDPGMAAVAVMLEGL